MTYARLSKYEESVIKEKSKVKWMEAGNSNTNFFYNSLKERRSRNNILVLNSRENVRLEEDREIGAECVEFYKTLFGIPSNNKGASAVIDGLQFDKLVSLEDSEKLLLPVTRDEVIEDLASIHSSKAHGPDGFKFAFSKALRPSLGMILFSELKSVSFYLWRSIQDNILLAHEIVRNYHKSISSPRCALKIDLHKAFDSVSWGAIVAVMKKFGLPKKLIDWIYICISTAKFSVMINGSPYGYFGAERGLRQGCPLSPYLFVMVMEVFSGLLQQQVSSGNYGLHPKCRATNLTYLCFADDVLVFFKGNVQSAQVLARVMTDFSNFSGLSVNCDKTSLFSSAVNPNDLEVILTCLK
ncbi:uncharacterized protein LOC113315713 [Papaver somniferum]|uniref:uncharacterized protein LOC113315713 n=1 Tax=Papaver somniferum TaxID=3469 RepID=UPI000E6F89D0|nr:uncharacterized protein LOC113315713 [Papaver somniferum]